MISLDCHHPDLLDFIDIKTSPDAVTKANISVRVTDDFMEAVINDKDWVMSFTRPETNETITKTAKAREIFEKLCRNNWDWGEPGILFWDTISNYNLLEYDDSFEYAGTNPCAEEPLPAGGSCLLSSINLSAFVRNKEFNFDDFGETVAHGIIYLNEVLEEGLPLHPLREQRQSVADWRQIGLGIMGLADMLIKMELPYDSEQARHLCERIGLVMADQALYTSAFLAGHNGSYDNYKSCVQKSGFLKNNTCESTREVIEAYGLRNSQLLTIAPTGTISTMLGISGGIEPIFANSYTRKTESLHGHDEYYKVYTPIVKEYMDEHGIKDEAELPNWFCTSSTISPLNRVLMQGAWQRHIDASISSTVNLPEEATIEDVEEIYLNAWKEGLKGITVFRNGCKRLGILTTDSSQEKEEEKGLPRGEIISCSDNLIGMKRRLTTGCGSLHCTAWFDPQTGDLMEIYLNKGSTGGCANFMVGLSRMISLACRGGVKIEDIADQLQSTGACPSYASRTATKHDTSKGACCPMAVGNALMEMWKEMKERIEKGNSIIALADSNSQISTSESRPPFNPEVDNGAKCPECGSELIQEGGCVICKSCGWSRCG
jgi:ribonucleoside-diphosphate reductase alpha chain